jgi:O-antigen/teichoic acid export membrane protein
MTQGKVPAPASIRRNAGLAFGGQLSTGVFTAILTLYLVRKLGPAEFGVFSLALGIGAMVLLPADFGLSQSAARFLAERRGDQAAMAQVMGDALRVKLIVAAVFGTLVFVAAGPIASVYGIPDLAWPVRAMAVALFAQSIFGLFRASFEAVGQMGVDWQVVASESAIEASASIALVALGGGAAGAAWGRAIGYAAGVLIALFLVVRLFGIAILRPRRKGTVFVRRLAGYGFAIFIIDGVYAVFAQVDILLVGAILGSVAAGIFAAPLRLVALLLYPASAITAGVAPRMSKGGKDGPNQEALELGLRSLLLIHLLFVVPLLVWAEPLVNLALGPGYAEAADVLRALVPFILLAGPTRLLTISVNYLGEARRRVVIVLGALALNIAVDLLLIPRIGVVGGAVGNDVAFALYAFGHLYVCRHLTGLPLMPLVRSLGRGLVAAAAMAAILVAFGRGDVPVPLMAIGLLVGTAVFLAILLVMREPVPAELSESFPGFVGRRLRRRASSDA